MISGNRDSVRENSLYGFQAAVSVLLVRLEITALGPLVPCVDGDERSPVGMSVHVILRFAEEMLGLPAGPPG